MPAASTLRASVTNAAGGENLCPDGNTQDGTQWAVTDSTLALVAPDPNDPTKPSDSPIGNNTANAESLLQITYSGAGTPTLTIPTYGILPATVYTVSAYVYVPEGMTPVYLTASGVQSGSSDPDGENGGSWVRISLTFTANASSDDTPPQIIQINPVDPPNGGDTLYVTGVLIQAGLNLNPYTDGGGQPGDEVQILVDGADTPVTAAGLAGYLPEPGDRLLVQKVGGLVEVIQFLSRGTVPYLTDVSDLQAQIDQTMQDIADTSNQINATSTDLSNFQTAVGQYQASNDAMLTGLQGAYDVLTGLGNAGVEEDYLWVGDDPAFSTVKKVQISTYVQAALFAPDGGSFADYFGLWTKGDIGDVTFESDDPPMTTFYTDFTNAGLAALPWNS